MKFEERSFRATGTAIPRPEIFFSPDDRLLIVATPWGPRSAAKQAIDIITDYFLSSRGDQEMTSPFQRLANLSTTANNLRIATLLANDQICQTTNRDEYVAGLEIFASVQYQSELVWVQMGQPHLFLSRTQAAMVPMGIQLDLAAELGKPNSGLSFLPSHLVGLDPNPNLLTNSIRPQEGDQLVLLSKSWIAESFFPPSPKARELESLGQQISRDTNDPFWLGLWTLGD